MLKKLSIALVAVVLFTAVSGCTAGTAKTDEGSGTTLTATVTDPPDDPVPPLKKKVFQLNTAVEGLRLLGERRERGTSVSCDYTGSGIELKVNHNGGDIIFTVTASGKANFRAFVDGAEWKNGKGSSYYTVDENTLTVLLPAVPAGERLISLVKTTGYSGGRVSLDTVSLAGTIQHRANTPSDLYIEFIGEGLMCGEGLCAGGEGVLNEDGMLAFPYLTAKALGADYSVTALTGRGLFAADGGFQSDYQFASPLRGTADKFDFARKADAVAVHIGEKDYSGNGDDFSRVYQQFLQQIYTSYGGVKIYCIYSAENTPYAAAVKDAAASFGGREAGIYLLCLESTDALPGAAAHRAISEKLAALIRDTAEDIPAKIPSVKAGGFGEIIDWQDGKKD